MVNEATRPGGAPSRARSSKITPPCVTYGELDGERVVCVPPIRSGDPLVHAASTWREMVRLGYARPPRIVGNGDGSTYYPVYSTTPSKPKEAHIRTGAALTLAIEAADGRIELPSRWRARARNGDPLDLRPSNLEAVPAERGRNTRGLVADVRKRRKLVAAGLDPNRVYAERRRAALEESRRSGGGMSEPRGYEPLGGSAAGRSPPSTLPRDAIPALAGRPAGGGR